MAHQMPPAQQHIFRYQSFYISKRQPLGHGSYGAVYKAKCDQLPCAAKVLHPIILDPTDPGASKIMDRFQQECAFLESIRHPNIVQYLGMTRDSESTLPVLLMELLDESLTRMLERSQQSLAYYIQVDICHDIALAVAYLHSNEIIHRDLSSNNVLMIAGRRAKVTDFGMSKLVGAAPRMTPLTMCPGTLAYMPPEALREPPRYTKKLDCFSEGVIMIQVCTRQWPAPGPRTQVIQDSRYPIGVIEVPVSEIERRKSHTDLIDPNHALLPITIDCLQFQDMDRPSSEELCQRLAGLKESREYRESIQTHHDEMQAKDNQISAQAQQLQEKVRLLQLSAVEITSRDQQLKDKDKLLQQRASEIASLSHQLHEKDKALLDKSYQLQLQSRLHQEEMAMQERQLRRVNQQLEEQKQVTAEIQQTNHSLQRQVKQLCMQQQLSWQSLKPTQTPPPHVEDGGKQLQERESLIHMPAQPSLHKPHLLKTNKVLQDWQNGDKTPMGMSRGAAIVDGNVAYFMNWSGQVCSYNISNKRWRELPECPHQHGGLAIINCQLTAIGGFDDYFDCTNKLLSLHTTWKEVFQPMPTKRCSPIAVTTEEHLIVAGGETGNTFDYSHYAVATVEVMDTKTLFWSTVVSLPQPYSYASGTICGDQLYMLGGKDNKGKTESVLTCPLTELVQSSSLSPSIWHRVAYARGYYSTCVAVNGELLAVGGCDEDDEPISSIHKYNPTANSWDLISNMPTPRYDSIVVVLPTNELMIVGGKSELRKDLNITEIAEFYPV